MWLTASSRTYGSGSSSAASITEQLGVRAGYRRLPDDSSCHFRRTRPRLPDWTGARPLRPSPARAEPFSRHRRAPLIADLLDRLELDLFGRVSNRDPTPGRVIRRPRGRNARSIPATARLRSRNVTAVRYRDLARGDRGKGRLGHREVALPSFQARDRTTSSSGFSSARVVRPKMSLGSSARRTVTAPRRPTT